jgi:hypothetical protein
MIYEMPSLVKLTLTTCSGFDAMNAEMTVGWDDSELKRSIAVTWDPAEGVEDEAPWQAIMIMGAEGGREPPAT